MTTRHWLLAALLFAACSAGGCTGYLEPLKDEEKPKAGELPQAPPPHVKKTTAELLVGRWNRVKFLGQPLRPGASVVLEFFKEGKFKFVNTSVGIGPQLTTGVYRVAGDTIRLTSDATPDSLSEMWDITIESISGLELALESGPPNGRQKGAYERMGKPK